MAAMGDKSATLARERSFVCAQNLAMEMDDDLFEALGHRLREDGAGTYTATHNLEVLEVGVLWTCLRLLVEIGSIELQGMGGTARWPRRESPIPLTEGLRSALLQLREQGWLAFKIDGGSARVTYGPRVVAVAEAWGIPFPVGNEETAETTIAV